jgi:hypothetical protein
MSAEPALRGPIFDLVTVNLVGVGDALTIIDRVVGALEQAGEYYAAASFIRTSKYCDTDDEVLRLADQLVTVIL